MASRWHLVVLSLLCALPTAAAEAPTPSLREAYQKEFLIGVALGGTLPGAYPPKGIEMIVKQFNAITPENCLKPQPVHPSEKIWVFEEPDALLKFAQENKMVVFGHTLLWHDQTPNWFFEDGGRRVSEEVVLKRLQNHIQTLMARYKGKIRGWDVANEALSDSPGSDLYLRNSPWQRALGNDYLEKAFRMAHEADPDAELQLNDYGIESGGKHQVSLQLLRSFKELKVPINSVGIQGHWVLDQVPFVDIEQSILDYKELGLKVAFTEVDIDVVPRRAAAGRAAATQPAEDLASVLKRQAEQYGKFFEILHKYRESIVRVTFWGTDDGRSWLNTWPARRTNHPLLFDRQYQPKPAFFSVLDVLPKDATPANR
jgi:endo-1,4-beta-xylanase